MSSPSALVAVNAHLLAGDATYRSAGISVYIAGLLRHLATVSDHLRFHVLLGEGVLPDGVRLPTTRSRFLTRNPLRRVMWEQAVLPSVLRRMGANLCHGPAFAVPLLSRCAQVVTLHDLSFLRHPKFFHRGNRLYLSLITRLSCHRAAAVIAVSNFTASEAVELLDLPSERVVTVYSGVSARFHPILEADVAKFREVKGLPERFILYLGTLEPRKNLIRLVRAFSRLADPDLHLVLAGAKGWSYGDIFKEVDRLGLQDLVHFPGFVPGAEQALWYNAARAFAYVSTYEGFGLPVIEALACGVPAVTSSTTSLPEAGGGGAIAVSPEDEAAIAEALHSAVTEETLRCELRQAGLAHAASFTWDHTALKTSEVYSRALDGRRA